MNAVEALSCQELVELVTDYLEGALAPGDLRRFEEHIEGCGKCTTYLAQMRETIRVTGTLTPEDLSPDAERELLGALQRLGAQLAPSSPSAIDPTSTPACRGCANVSIVLGSPGIGDAPCDANRDFRGGAAGDADADDLLHGVRAHSERPAAGVRGERRRPRCSLGRAQRQRQRSQHRPVLCRVGKDLDVRDATRARPAVRIQAARDPVRAPRTVGEDDAHVALRRRGSAPSGGSARRRRPARCTSRRRRSSGRCAGRSGCRAWGRWRACGEN